ncbi:FAD-linked oxidase C-terminal domain-containing protein [Methylotetracoccus oryzae]|uniref:FAD-linked oxidase C-terminal domain-containing protein n=1 Tax=Methylotetracoccus oryzae TaxID=1919059 RepID=UPI00111B135F|nr:FAD-linked oxidase C-terminal domain-containing protein [Methylotetracoccus oryzae]
MTHRSHPSEQLAHHVDKDAFVRALRRKLGPEAVLADPEDLRPYECDALSAYRTLPWIVVLPQSTAEVQAVMQLCHAAGVPVVARGAGTGLSGGALPVENGVLLSLTRLNRILAIDAPNRLARVQPGVRNAAVTEAVAPLGLLYAPDPSSQIACTIGGNVAENSGGVHCLKYGLTVHNLTEIKLVTVEGELLTVGGMSLDAPGYDLLALLTGSEGLLGIIVEVVVKLILRPASARALLAAFDDIGAAGAAVANIIGAGLLPAGLEFMDAVTIRATEAFVHAGYPVGAAAILLCEFDGLPEQVDADVAAAEAILVAARATEVRRAADDAERLRFWMGRKAAFPAVGRIAADYYCMDGTIPRRCLADVLRGISTLAEEFGLGVANVFHAGDGNLHPLILYDANRPGELEQAERLGARILQLCLDVGGTVTGEHGVGVEKIDLLCRQFPAAELAQFHAVKRAFDPHGLLNPGKAVPSLRRCAELGAMHVHGGQLPFPELERF